MSFLVSAPSGGSPPGGSIGRDGHRGPALRYFVAVAVAGSAGDTSPAVRRFIKLAIEAAGAPGAGLAGAGASGGGAGGVD